MAWRRKRGRLRQRLRYTCVSASFSRRTHLDLSASGNEPSLA
jgi:hypothetical protein